MIDNEIKAKDGDRLFIAIRTEQFKKQGGTITVLPYAPDLVKYQDCTDFHERMMREAVSI